MLFLYADWLTLSKESGSETNATIEVMASENTSEAPRSAIITLNAAESPSFQISVTQNGIYPNYNISPAEPDATGMTCTAPELAEKIVLG